MQNILIFICIVIAILFIILFYYKKRVKDNKFLYDKLKTFLEIRRNLENEREFLVKMYNDIQVKRAQIPSSHYNALVKKYNVLINSCNVLIDENEIIIQKIKQQI